MVSLKKVNKYYIENQNLSVQDLESVNCDLCKSEKSKIWMSLGMIKIVKCTNCGLLYTSPRPTIKYLDGLYKQKEYYDVSSASWSISFIPGYLKRLQYIKNYLSTESDEVQFLEIGAGGGVFSLCAKLLGFSTLSNDFSTASQSRMKQLGLNICDVDLSELESMKFDVITSFHVLEHADSPKEMINECGRLLKKAGVLSLEVPNFDCKDYYYDKQLLKKNLSLPFHRYFFKLKDLKMYLHESGFKIINIQHGLSPLFAKIVRIVKKQKMLDSNVGNKEYSVNELVLTIKNEIKKLSINDNNIQEKPFVRFISKYFPSDFLVIYAVKE